MLSTPAQPMEKRQKNIKRFFSVQWKMLMLVIVVIGFGVVIGFLSIVGFRQIEAISTHIVKEYSSIMKSIHEVLLSTDIGRLATEQILDVDRYSQIEEINSLEVIVDDSFKKTNAFIAALTWGSETDAFRESSNGANDAVWTDLGLRGAFVVMVIDKLNAQFIGQVSILYNGFIKKTLDAIELHLEFLRLRDEGKTVAALEAEEQSRVLITEARHLYDLTLHNLSEIVNSVEILTEKAGQELLLTESKIQNRILAILVVGFLVSLIFSMLFSQSIIMKPTTILISAAKEYGAGKFDTRINLNTNDEMQELADAFNGMAERLSNYTGDLEAEVKERTGEISKQIVEYEKLNKFMVGREVRMAELKREIDDLKEKVKNKQT